MLSPCLKLGRATPHGRGTTSMVLEFETRILGTIHFPRIISLVTF